VGRTLVNLQCPVLPVRVANLSDAERKIEKGSVIAECDAVESVMVGEVPRTKTTSPDNVPSHLEDLFERSSRNLDEHQKEQLRLLLNEFADVFSAGSHDLGRTTMVKHKINTSDANPIRQPPRRLPRLKKAEAASAIDDMLKQGIIEPSSSPWAAPIVLVKKKDGTSRFCVD
jgi:hypothetical protein